jgi:hypothetical protein
MSGVNGIDVPGTLFFGSSPDLGFLVIYKGLHKIDREKSYTAGSYPM